MVFVVLFIQFHSLFIYKYLFLYFFPGPLFVLLVLRIHRLFSLTLSVK